VPVGGRPAEELGDDQHRERLGEAGDDVHRTLGRQRHGAPVEQVLGQLLDPGPEPFHVPAAEGAGHQPPQPGVRGRLHLQQRVLVQPVERVPLPRRTSGTRDPQRVGPAQVAAAQHLAGVGVRGGEPHPEAVVARQRPEVADRGEQRVRVGDGSGVAEGVPEG
jgi:hypothetical protein